MQPPPGNDLVIQALRRQGAWPELDLPSWDLLVRQARSADLLARLAATLQSQGTLDAVPASPQAHLRAALALSQAQHLEVRREIAHIAHALAPLQVQVVLLKGAAYVAAGLPAACGRVFSDVDILVPRDRLEEVEAALMSRGWTTTHRSEYDQRYYRAWMHELPPMQHTRRHTLVDVHHAIVPLTARARPDAAAMLRDARPLDHGTESGHLHVLSDVDMVLHSMAHLVHNEVMQHALRDLSDIDLLLRQHAPDAAFWPALADRAGQLQLSRCLYYGLQHARSVLGTPVPQRALDAAQQAAPMAALRPLMHRLWGEAFRSPHPSTATAWTRPALSALFVRAHWLRMPPSMLVRHAAAKLLLSMRHSMEKPAAQ
jgi:hypothetical protein